MKYLTDYETTSQYDAVKKDLPKPQVALTRDDYKVHFKPNKHDYSQDYLTIVAKENGTIMFQYCYEDYQEGKRTSISYSVNDGNWVTTQYEGGQEIYVNVSNGDKVRWKGINKALAYDSGEGVYTSYFSCDFEFDAEGNVMSLLYGDNFTDKITLTERTVFTSLFGSNGKLMSTKNLILPATTLALSAYSQMFAYCTSLTEAPQLPATTLAERCYEGMFSGCTSLTTAPELPATTLASNCYSYMFGNCASLTEAPQLLATTLAQECYSYMFDNCTSLTEAPELNATSLASYCYRGMFYNCTSLREAPELPATTLADSCYNSMFNGCTSLVTAPQLPATTLTIYCYASMFYGCASLTEAPQLLATTLASVCYYEMFENCYSLETAPQLPATTLAPSCYEGMFRGCTSLITAPELPATTLASGCYQYMFRYCSQLNHIECLATNISARNCTDWWVDGVASSGTFVRAASMTSWATGTNGIPIGWEVEPPLDDYIGR